MTRESRESQDGARTISLAASREIHHESTLAVVHEKDAGKNLHHSSTDNFTTHSTRMSPVENIAAGTLPRTNTSDTESGEHKAGPLKRTISTTSFQSRQSAASDRTVNLYTNGSKYEFKLII